MKISAEVEAMNAAAEILFAPMPVAKKPKLHWTYGDNTLLLLARSAKLCDEAHQTIGAFKIREEINSDNIINPNAKHLTFHDAVQLVSQFVELTGRV